MHRIDVLNGLYFKNEAVIDNDVHLIAIFEFDTLVADRQSFLASNGNTGVAKFKAQAFFVGTFQQSRTELAMNQ